MIGVFAWEMSLRYEYSMRYARYYALRFAIRFEEETVLDAIQPVDFVAGLPCPIAFANGVNRLTVARMISAFLLHSRDTPPAFSSPASRISWVVPMESPRSQLCLSAGMLW